MSSFLLSVIEDRPEEAGGYNGFTSNRTNEKYTIHVVNGKEEICSIPYEWESIKFRVDGFIRDNHGEPTGIYLQIIEEGEEDRRYELLVDQTINVVIPTALPSYGGGDYDSINFTLTLRG